MLVIDGQEIRARAPMPQVIACLENAFRADHVAPPRQLLQLPGGSGERLLLFMPAFDPRGGAVKLATVFPDNAANGLPTISAAIVAFSESGAPAALLDGATVTQLRTGAASALASKYLSREDSSELVLIGTGAVAPQLAAAHCAVRPIKQISVWGRRPERALAATHAIRTLVGRHVQVRVVEELESAVRAADIVSCATSSATPVLFGSWLKAGTFVDLVGSFSRFRRESDDDTILCARVFVDTLEGALAEAGDLLEPLTRGVISREHILGELADLVKGRVAGRSSRHEITLFKSVGSAIEDLAVVRMVCAQFG